MTADTSDLPPLREWRTIPTAPQYEASSAGDIRHKKKQNYLTPMLRNGRFFKRSTVRIYVDGKPHSRSVLQLLIETFPERFSDPRKYRVNSQELQGI